MSGEMAKGAAWMILFRLFDRAIGIVSTALLARLLIPADFGLVAMAMSIIAMIELATAFSFEIALIQKPDPQREHYDTAWTLNIIVAAVCASVIAGLSQPAQAFYGDARLGPVMLAIAAALFISGFENPGTVDFRRRMDFAAEFRLMAGKRVVAFVVTIAAALTFRSYWALVIGAATGRLTGVAMSYLMQPFRPRLSLARAHELFKFSGWVLANNAAGALLSKVPHFFVGRMFGAQALGAYTVGAEIAALAHTELIAPINRAMFPGYSRLTGDPQALRRTCIDASALIVMLVLPVSVGVAVMAAPFVRVLLGSQWSNAVPIIQILALAGVATAITSNNVAAYLALGRPHVVTVTFGVRLALLAAVVVPLIGSFGLIGMAWAELVAAVGSLAISVPVLISTLQIRWRDYLLTLWRPMLASALMALLIAWALPEFAADGPIGDALVQLFVGTAIGTIAFPTLIWVLWQLVGRPQSVETLIWQRLCGTLAGVPRKAG